MRDPYSANQFYYGNFDAVFLTASAAWDRQIDVDSSRAGVCPELRKGFAATLERAGFRICLDRADASRFWKAFDRLPAAVHDLPEKYALWKGVKARLFRLFQFRLGLPRYSLPCPSQAVPLNASRGRIGLLDMILENFDFQIP